jgi:hypothetical protein
LGRDGGVKSYSHLVAFGRMAHHQSRNRGSRDRKAETELRTLNGARGQSRRQRSWGGVPWGILPVNPSSPLVTLQILDIGPVNPLELLVDVAVGNCEFAKTLRFLSDGSFRAPVNYPSGRSATRQVAQGAGGTLNLEHRTLNAWGGIGGQTREPVNPLGFVVQNQHQTREPLNSRGQGWCRENGICENAEGFEFVKRQ